MDSGDKELRQGDKLRDSRNALRPQVTADKWGWRVEGRWRGVGRIWRLAAWAGVCNDWHVPGLGVGLMETINQGRSLLFDILIQKWQREPSMYM